MKIYENLSSLIGNTPLLELKNVEELYSLEAKLVVKLEKNNPTGSAKDRVAKEMIEDAEKRGVLKKGGTIIEPTSGNTGIGIASLAASKGYKAIIVMPDTMSIERRNLMKAFGAELVLTDGKLGMQGAIEKAKELNEKVPNSIIAGQFENPANPNAHYKTTGPEIFGDTDGQVDYLVATVGTGGTITGTAKYLKEKKPAVKVIGVEPSGSPMISKGISGSHKIQGIGAGFIPSILDLNLIDEIIAVSDEYSYEYARLVAKKEGLLVGISSGAALKAGIELASRKEAEGKIIVIILPDTGERYLSTPDFI